MSRFRKGTLDHDNDGRKGGSMPAKKAPAKAKAAKKPAAPKLSAQAKAELEAEAVRMASTSDPQSGGAQIISEDVPSAKEVIAAKKAAVEAQFATADAKGDAKREAIEEATLSRQIRGY